MSSYQPASEIRLRELAAQISRMTEIDSPLVMQQRTQSLAQTALLYALARNAAISGQEALDLWLRGRHLSAMPLVRLVWECGITAQWLSQSETAAEAMLNEHVRLRGALAKNLERSAMFGGPGVTVADADLEMIETAMAAGGRSFEQRCNTLTGGADLYVSYRLMSWSCHAGIDLFDEFIEPRGDNGVALREEPKMDEAERVGWPVVTVVAMMWAARAMDWFRPGRPHRSALRKIARELTAVEHLRLTPEAKLTEQRRLQQLRTEQRKGPRSRPQSATGPQQNE